MLMLPTPLNVTVRISGFVFLSFGARFAIQYSGNGNAELIHFSLELFANPLFVYLSAHVIDNEARQCEVELIDPSKTIA